MQPSGESLESVIRTLRGQRVILDADLARIYGVATGRLNEAVKRNRGRFPLDFAFQLSKAECANLISQFAISSVQANTQDEVGDVQHSPKRGGLRSRPWAFTEHGALMAANVLRSARAVEMSVFVVRAFVQMRERLSVDATILERLAEIDATLLEHDRTLREIWEELQPLVSPGVEPPQRRIGFHVRDRSSQPGERARPGTT